MTRFLEIIGSIGVGGMGYPFVAKRYHGPRKGH